MLECLLPTLSICFDSFVRGVKNEPNDFGLIISLAPSGKAQRKLYCYLSQSSETEEDRKGDGTPRTLPFPARTVMGLILSLHAVTSCRLKESAKQSAKTLKMNERVDEIRKKRWF